LSSWLKSKRRTKEIKSATGKTTTHQVINPDALPHGEKLESPAVAAGMHTLDFVRDFLGYILI
jgi:hypothetical protein